MKFVFTLFLLSSLTLFAQDRELIQGKIVSRSKDLKGIYVGNVNTGESVATSKGGYFGLYAKESDTLMFSGALFIGYRRVVDEMDLNKEMIFIPLEENDLSTQLNEIVITKISSLSLGLVTKDLRKYTPAERRLFTAQSGSGIIPVDLIVNAITGRTKMLKKALEYEKHEMRKEKLLRLFDEEYIRKNLSIPQDYVLGFAYNAAYDEQMIALLNDRNSNKEQIQLRLGDLAFNFLELIKDKTQHKSAL